MIPQSKEYEIVLVSVSTPSLMGVYCDGKLIFRIIIDGRVSDTLPLLFCAFLCNEQGLCGILQSLDSAKYRLIYSGFNCGFSLDSKYLENLKLQNIESKELQNLDSRLQQNLSTQDSLKISIKILSYFKNFKNIYYARGLGSLSAIKLTHIFLHTLSLSKNIKLYATNSFYFTESKEIRAFGNMSFFLQDEFLNNEYVWLDSKNLRKRVKIAKSMSSEARFSLPQILKKEYFMESCSPLYITPAI